MEFKVEDLGDDKEVTLGPMILTAMGLGLLVICCICFLAGYVVGHRAQLSRPSGTTASSSGNSAIAELLAEAHTLRPASGSPAPHTTSTELAGGLTPAAAAQEPAPPPANELPNTEPQASKAASAPTAVRAALTQPAAQATASWVVQVAAVENIDDADVLVNALRQRGYSVTAHHRAGDNLIHVQVGPFASRSDADSMRQKLLNDGYNANVEQ